MLLFGKKSKFILLTFGICKTKYFILIRPLSELNSNHLHSRFSKINLSYKDSADMLTFNLNIWCPGNCSLK